MATFYGQVKGNANTPATRCGSKASGIKVSAQSYEGSVIVEMFKDKEDNTVVEIRISDESSSRGSLEYSGSIEGLLEKLRG